MTTPTKKTFQHIALYGQTDQDDPDFVGNIPNNFTFNSLVGCCMDKQQRVWVCDTGNDRVLVLDNTLCKIIRILKCPERGGKEQGGLNFRMPFHLCQHPDNNQMYITDMGNSRVVVMEYSADKIQFSHVFGNTESDQGAPLQDPNGITIVRDKDGTCFVHVNDEFFHTETDKLRNRCVRYTDKGVYVDEFRTVIDPDGNPHDIYWPQGISSDQQGNLYLANTGNYEILKVPANAPVEANYTIHGKMPVVHSQFNQPSGLGMMNIMRFVTVIGKHVFVPDHILNTISVYDMAGTLCTTLSGIRPSWNHGEESVHSLTDPIYYNEEDALLLNPYVICQGETDDIYFVTEPFSSRLIKLHIPQLTGTSAAMTMLAALGERRNQPGKHGADPQFNVVTAVAGFKQPPHQPLTTPTSGDLPPWLKFNPFQQWYMALANMVTTQYQQGLGKLMDQWLTKSTGTHDSNTVRLNMDAGNWRIKAYLEQKDGFSAVRENIISGYFLPGNLSMTTYYPQVPLLGQICPQTPILLIANFNFGMISMYQIGPLGQLLNYGVPFGFYGQFEGCMRGPQGMAVSDEGEVFIVDSLNNRISKWQILQTGQVVFIKNFAWYDKSPNPTSFTPTDVAMGAKKRLFVTDQFNNRICVFDHDGKSLWSYGKEGYWQEGEPDGGNFMLPTSLAIDGNHLILNDLVNRALKLFRIEDKTLTFLGGISLFKLELEKGGVWMPFFMYARDHEVYIADSTYNVVQVFKY